MLRVTLQVGNTDAKSDFVLLSANNLPCGFSLVCNRFAIFSDGPRFQIEFGSGTITWLRVCLRFFLPYPCSLPLSSLCPRSFTIKLMVLVPFAFLSSARRGKMTHPRTLPSTTRVADHLMETRMCRVPSGLLSRSRNVSRLMVGFGMSLGLFSRRNATARLSGERIDIEGMVILPPPPPPPP